MKRTPLKRKTPLPLATTPMKKAKSGVARAQMKQRAYVRTRSGGRCEFERLANTWTRCPNRGGETAHIYRRPKCGKARDSEFVVIDACHQCHTAFDRYDREVRVPLRYAQAAWEEILCSTRLGENTEERVRIHIGSLGQRPENGADLYA